MSIGINKVKNKVLRQNHFYYYYSSFRAAPLIFKTCLQLSCVKYLLHGQFIKLEY